MIRHRRSWAGDDPGPHPVDQIEHLLVPGRRRRECRSRRSALGVLPPLWSSAATKPCPWATVSACSGFMDSIVPELLTDVGGRCLLTLSNKLSKNSACGSRLEVGDGGGDCPGGAA